MTLCAIDDIFRNTLYNLSQKSLQYLRFHELAEIAYQFIDIYLDIPPTICNASV
jgi:hypothetical protein